ncbi:unnamed protein product, partial [Closterium sp. Naga37s-1]
LASHLDKVGFELSLVTTEWFLCVFAKTFPSEVRGCAVQAPFSSANTRLRSHLLTWACETPTSQSLSPSRVTTEWFLCVFAKTFPSEINEAELMTAQHLGDVVEILNRSSSRHFDPDILLQVRPYPHAPPSHLLSCECCVKVAFDRVAFDRLGTMSMATFSSNASGRAFNHPFYCLTSLPLPLQQVAFDRLGTMSLATILKQHNGQCY